MGNRTVEMPFIHEFEIHQNQICRYPVIAYASHLGFEMHM